MAKKIKSVIRRNKEFLTGTYAIQKMVEDHRYRLNYFY